MSEDWWRRVLGSKGIARGGMGVNEEVVVA